MCYYNFQLSEVVAVTGSWLRSSGNKPFDCFQQAFTFNGWECTILEFWLPLETRKLVCNYTIILQSKLINKIINQLINLANRKGNVGFDIWWVMQIKLKIFKILYNHKVVIDINCTLIYTAAMGIFCLFFLFLLVLIPT